MDNSLWNAFKIFANQKAQEFDLPDLPEAGFAFALNELECISESYILDKFGDAAQKEFLRLKPNLGANFKTTVKRYLSGSLSTEMLAHYQSNPDFKALHDILVHSMEDR